MKKTQIRVSPQTIEALDRYRKESLPVPASLGEVADLIIAREISGMPPKQKQGKAKP